MKDILRNGFPYDIDESKSWLELAIEGVPQFIITAKEVYDKINECMQEMGEDWGHMSDFIASFDAVLNKHREELYDMTEGGKILDPEKLKDRASSSYWDDIETMGVPLLFSPYEGVYLSAYNLWLAIDHDHRGYSDKASYFLHKCANIEMIDKEWLEQVEAGRSSPWHTQPLIEICKRIRRGNASATQEGMFNILARSAEGWIDIETNRYGDTTIWFTCEGKKNHELKLSGFKRFERTHREEIGRKKKI